MNGISVIVELETGTIDVDALTDLGMVGQREVGKFSPCPHWETRRIQGSLVNPLTSDRIDGGSPCSIREKPAILQFQRTASDIRELRLQLKGLCIASLVSG